MFLEFYNRILEISEEIPEIQHSVRKYCRDMVYVAPEQQAVRFYSNITKVQYIARAYIEESRKITTCQQIIDECEESKKKIKFINC